MTTFESERIWNMGILGHGHAGKTGVAPVLWTVYGFRIKPHLSASIHS